MPGFMHRRAKARRPSNGYGIHVLAIFKDVDGRDKPGHDAKLGCRVDAHFEHARHVGRFPLAAVENLMPA